MSLPMGPVLWYNVFTFDTNDKRGPKMQAKQSAMFQVEDLPLFSGTAQTFRKSSKPRAASMAGQATFADCRICMDTGKVGGRFCWCAAGSEAKRSK